MNDNIRKELRFWGLLIVVLTVGYVFSNFIGLSQKGFDTAEILGLQTFYLIGIIYAVILIAGHFYEVASKKGDSKYGTSIAFSSQGDSPHLSVFKRFTVPQFALLCVIFFIALALLNLYLPNSQKSYTGLNLLQVQQFSPVASVVYSTSLIPAAENLGAAALAVLLVITIGVLARKYNWSSSLHKFSLAISIILGYMFFAVGNHFLRYSGSDVSLITVAAFWAVGGLITYLTGSFIPFWIMHIFNNLSLDIFRFFSSDMIQITAFGIVLALSFLYLFIYKNRLLGVKPSQIPSIE